MRLKDTQSIHFACYFIMSQEIMMAMLNRATNGAELLEILESLVEEVVEETEQV